MTARRATGTRDREAGTGTTIRRLPTCAVTPPRGRRGSGRTGQRRERRQRRSRLAVRALAAILIGVPVVAAVVFGPRLVDRLTGGGPAGAAAGDREAPLTGGEVDPQPTAVLATFDERDPAAGASRVALLAYDRDAEAGTILLVPAATVADVPGHGLLPLRRAYGFGQGPLLGTTVENLLGVDLDQVVGVSQQGWASLFTRLGGLTVTLDDRLDRVDADGGGEIRFQPGEQFLDGPRVAELLTFEQAGESELEALTRTQTVLVGLLDLLAGDPALLDAVFEDGAPMLDAPDPAALRDLLGLLAGSRARDATTTFTLPVSPLGSGADDSFRLDAARAADLMADRLGASQPEGATATGTRLQVLNGNGRPGIGQRVAERLLPEGYRVVLTGNADSFDYDQTRILVYGDGREQLAAAQRIRDLLGVGVVEVSGSPQSVVDITIIVGADFDPGRDT